MHGVPFVQGEQCEREYLIMLRLFNRNARRSNSSDYADDMVTFIVVECSSQKVHKLVAADNAQSRESAS